MTPLQFVEAAGACKRGIVYVEALAPPTFASLFAQCPRSDWLCWILDAAWYRENKGTWPDNAWERDHWKIFLNLWMNREHAWSGLDTNDRSYLETSYYLFRGWDDTHKKGAVPLALEWKEAYGLTRFLYNLGQAGIAWEVV